MDVSDEVQTLRTVIKVQQAINDADPTAGAVMKMVAEQACEATGAPGAVVELAEGDEMVYTVTAGSLVGTEGVRLPRVGSLTGEAVRLEKVLISVDTETDDADLTYFVHYKLGIIERAIDQLRDHIAAAPDRRPRA